jgi:hypothetical protein
MEHADRRVDRDLPGESRPVAHRAGEGSPVNALQSPARNAVRDSGLILNLFETAAFAAVTSEG